MRQNAGIRKSKSPVRPFLTGVPGSLSGRRRSEGRRKIKKTNRIKQIKQIKQKIRSMNRKEPKKRKEDTMTDKDILDIALRQSATDLGCKAEDLQKDEPVIVTSTASPDARRYLKLPFLLNLCSYGTNVVASVHPEKTGESEGSEGGADYASLREDVGRYLRKFPPYHCFETPNLHVLRKSLGRFGADVCFMAEYFLPKIEKVKPLPCPYRLGMLEASELSPYYLPAWSNALCKDRKELDRLAFCAYDGDELIGMAGASADCEDMWQIGIDVLPKARKKGVGASLVSALALEILARGKVPFYCCAWSNIPSARTAFASGFVPAWVECTAKKKDFIGEMNGEPQL